MSARPVEPARVAGRVAAASLAIAAAALPSIAGAQAWSVQGGVAARAEYNDNYFFSAGNEESATTATLTPFLAAARRTEVSQVTAVLAVGVNDVSGPTLTSNSYGGGRFILDGSLREATSLWTGQASYERTPRLESERTASGTILGLVNTNTALVGGGYTRAVTERLSLGATLGAYDNEYDRLETNTAPLPDNHGYNVGGRVGYSVSDRTLLTVLPVYGRYYSDITRSDYTTVVFGVVHQFSPQFSVSVSAGGFRSDIEETDTGLRRRDDGQLYGGSASYAFSERTRFELSLAEGLSPSAIGTITANRNAYASLAHNFSDRLTARLGAGYERTVSPESLTGSSRTTNYRGEVGVSYLISEDWRLEAGYRYGRATYSQDATEPRSNVAFLSIGYNWPGTALGDQVARSPDTQGLPAAGPQSMPGGTGATRAGPFDRYTIP